MIKYALTVSPDSRTFAMRLFMIPISSEERSGGSSSSSLVGTDFNAEYFGSTSILSSHASCKAH